MFFTRNIKLPQPIRHSKIGLISKANFGIGDLKFALYLHSRFLEAGYRDVHVFLIEKQDKEQLKDLGVSCEEMLDFKVSVSKDILRSYDVLFIGPGVREKDLDMKGLAGCNVCLISEGDHIHDLEEIAKKIEEYNKLVSPNDKILVSKMYGGFSPLYQGVGLCLLKDDKKIEASAPSSDPAAVLRTQLLKGDSDLKLETMDSKAVISLAYVSIFQADHIPLLHAAAQSPKMQKENFKSCCFVMIAPGEEGIMFEYHKRPREFYKPEYLEKFLWPVLSGEWGYNKVVLETRVAGERRIYQKMDLKSELEPIKEFRMICMDKILFKDMQLLHKLAENNFRTITGDHSLAEALAVKGGCPFFYIGASHKDIMLLELAKLIKDSKDSEIESIFNNFCVSRKRESMCISFLSLESSREFVQYYTLAELILKNQDSFKELCLRVQKEYNLGDNVLMRFEKDRLLFLGPLVAVAALESESKIETPSAIAVIARKFIKAIAENPLTAFTLQETILLRAKFGWILQRYEKTWPLPAGFVTAELEKPGKRCNVL